MSKTYIINLTRQGYQCTTSRSAVQNTTLTNYTTSTSNQRFGATGGYATGYATLGKWPVTNVTSHIKSLNSSEITSIVLHATCSGVGYNIGTRWGLAYSSSSARLTSASASTTTVAKNATSITLTATSMGVPTYGWVIGGTQSSTSYGTISKMWVVITTTEENVTGDSYVSLFQGVWSAGSVTISGLSDYGLFKVKFATLQGNENFITSALAVFGGSSDTYFRGKGGFSSSSSNSQEFYVYCSRSENTLTFQQAHYKTQDGTITTIAISEIIGII